MELRTVDMKHVDFSSIDKKPVDFTSLDMKQMDFSYLGLPDVSLYEKRVRFVLFISHKVVKGFLAITFLLLVISS